MQVKRFRAESLREALDQVKKQMGPNAMIVSTDTVSAGGPFGLFPKEMVEVTATAEAAPAKAAWTPPASAARSAPAQPTSFATTYGTSGRVQKPPAPAHPEPRMEEPATPQIAEIHQNLHELRQMFKSLATQPQGYQASEQRMEQHLEEIRGMLDLGRKSTSSALEASALDLLRRLLDSGVDERLASRLIEACQTKLRGVDERTPGAVMAVARTMISRLLATTSDLITAPGRHVIALLGATGVGKTTTIAKLAARAVAAKRSVALVSVDTFRIGAAEQLRIYARILGVPYHVAEKPADLVRVMAATADKDLVFIDTIGSAASDAKRLQEITQLLGADERIQSHMVLAINTRSADMARSIDAYTHLKPKSLMLTKLDESDSYGVMLDATARARLPISYVCYGQNVPEDIMPAGTADLSRLVLERKLERIVPPVREAVA